MKGSFLKLMLALMLLAVVAAGCGEKMMTSNHNISGEVDHWEMTPAGVPVARY